MQKLLKPSKNDLQLLKEWLERPEGGNFFLRGREANIWDNDLDVVATSGNKAEQDSFTKLVADKVVPWYHHRWGFRRKVSLTELKGMYGS